jgi:16S rRNA processing protein RimM
MKNSQKKTESKNKMGSPSEGEPIFLVVGKLRRPHGLGGDLLMEVITDFPERLKPGVQVYVGDFHQPMRIHNLRWHDQLLLVTFEECNSLDEASALRNNLIFVRADDRPALDEGEYYHHELLGMLVRSDEGELLGNLTEILVTGANDVYVVTRQDGKQVLLPAIESVILEINPGKKEMLVHLIPGLV